MWTERNLDRHGRDEVQEKETARQRHLREVSVWYDHRDGGVLDLTSSEDRMFCDTFQEHQHREGDSALADRWLCAWRPVLLQTKLCAAEATRKASNSFCVDDVRVGSGVSDDDSWLE